MQTIIIVVQGIKHKYNIQQHASISLDVLGMRPRGNIRIWFTCEKPVGLMSVELHYRLNKVFSWNLPWHSRCNELLNSQWATDDDSLFTVKIFIVVTSVCFMSGKIINNPGQVVLVFTGLLLVEDILLLIQEVFFRSKFLVGCPQYLILWRICHIEGNGQRGEFPATNQCITDPPTHQLGCHSPHLSCDSLVSHEPSSELWLRFLGREFKTASSVVDCRCLKPPCLLSDGCSSLT